MSEFTFTPGKAYGQWQSLDGRFVLRCPGCGNRFGVQPFQSTVKDPHRPQLWTPKCPHRGCGWRVNIATLEGAAPERTRLMVELHP